MRRHFAVGSYFALECQVSSLELLGVELFAALAELQALGHAALGLDALDLQLLLEQNRLHGREHPSHVAALSKRAYRSQQGVRFLRRALRP